MGVPLNHPFLDRFFPANKPSILWIPHLWKPPYIYCISIVILVLRSPNMSAQHSCINYEEQAFQHPKCKIQPFLPPILCGLEHDFP